LLGDVTDRNSGEARHTEFMRDLTQDFIERTVASTGVVGTLDAFAKGDPSAAVERSGELELLEHSVDSIHRLVDVFQDEDAIAEIRCERSPA